MSAERYESRERSEALRYRRRTRLHKLMTMAAIPLLLLLLPAEVKAQSAIDGFDPKPNSTVDVVVVQPDGKILIGGVFTKLAPNGGPQVTRNHIARLNLDGTLDTAFNPNPNGGVSAIALQPDGKILVGGTFSGANSIGGQTRNYIARLDGTTGLADSFNPNANAGVTAIAVQADGKILVGGGGFGTGIARLDPVTGLADAFAASPDGPVTSILPQGDKILIAGYFSRVNGEMHGGIARLDATTGAPDTFRVDAATVHTIAVQADGKILAGGIFTTIGGQNRNHIARIDAVTSLVDSFNPNANNRVYSIAVQPDGKILAVGDFSSIGGQTRQRIARLDPNTGLADSFNPIEVEESGGMDVVAVQPDGKVLVGGNFSGPPRPSGSVSR